MLRSWKVQGYVALEFALHHLPHFVGLFELLENHFEHLVSDCRRVTANNLETGINDVYASASLGLVLSTVAS